MIVSLAWRNIWRRPTRTALSAIGVAFASMLLVFMLSFQLGSYDVFKQSALQIADGFGQFQPVGYQDDPEISRVIADPAALLADLRAIPGVTVAAPRANGFVLLANGERTFAAAIAGVDPAREAEVSTLSTLIGRGRALAADDGAAIVLGEGLARNLRVGIGDEVTMLGSGFDGSVAADVLRLVGVFETRVPEIDRSLAQMPLERFRESFLMNEAVNVVAVSGDSVPDVEAAGDALRALADRYGLVYLDWAALRPEIEQAIAFDLATAVLTYAILVLLVAIVIFNTLYMSVLERGREFGVLLALGMKHGQIGRMVWLEMVFLSALGAGIGVLLGIAVTAYFQRTGVAIEGMEDIYAQWGLPSRFFPAMTLMRVLSGPLAIMAIIALLGIIPIRHVRRLAPALAMAA